MVDDNETNRFSLCKMLASENLSSDEAGNGVEAIEKLKERKTKQCGCWYQIIFMDICMPEMDGLQASKIISQMISKFEIQPCPIIACPAAGALSKEEKDVYYAAGIADLCIFASVNTIK